MKYKDVAEEYDKLFTKDVATYSETPMRIVERVREFVTSGDVLEVGAGALGRHSIYLASQGFNVLATDISSVAVENTRALARAKNVPLQTDVFDIADKELESDFDVIIATFFLHELYTDDAVSVIQKMRRHTKPKGVNIIATFTNNGDFDKTKSPRFFVRDNKELESFYSDWTTHLSFEMKTGLSQRGPNGEQLFQIFAGLLSQNR